MEEIIKTVKRIASKSDSIDIIRVEEIPFSVEGIEEGIYTDIVSFSFKTEAMNTIYYFLAEVVMELPTVETTVVAYNDDNTSYASVDFSYVK